MTVEEEAVSCEHQDVHSSEKHNGCRSHSLYVGDGPNTLNWPAINNVPINEFHTPYFATMSFPTLFPYGTGDPTYPRRQHPVSLTDGFKHLIKYGDISYNNIKSWRLQSILVSFTGH